jgi:hypothetical protein
LETHGTLFHGKQAAVELIVRVLACLAEGLGIRATARVFEVAPTTVLQWLGEAAEQRRAFSASFLCDLHLEQLQRTRPEEETSMQTTATTPCAHHQQPGWELRLHAVLALLGGEPVPQVTARFGMGRSILYKYLSKSNLVF